MANATVNLALVKSGYVKQSNPYTVYTTNTSTQYQISDDNSGNKNYLYLGFAAMPSNLRHNVLVNMSITFAARAMANSVSYIYVHTSHDFNPSTLTYNNQPKTNYYGFQANITATTDNVLRNVTGVDSRSSPDLQTYYFFDSSRCVNIYSYDKSSSSSDDMIYAKTVLANGSNSYVTITYDNATKVKSQLKYSGLSKSTVNPSSEITTSWDLIQEDGSAFCADPTFAQVSAEFKYRVQGASQWNSISVSGNTKSVTIPAYTFSSGNTYEYYVSAVDEDGTQSNSSTRTFTTPATQITATNSPSSGYVNPRNATSFSWYYNSSLGTFQAGDTTLHWKESDSETWNDVAADTGATSITIPADTFTVRKTIQWYLSGTDVTGYASQTPQYSFSTQDAYFSSFPSSPVNTVEDGSSEITLRWTYISPNGTAARSYKILYKGSNDQDFTELTNQQGAANTFVVPANTFPSGEVEWYVMMFNADNYGHTDYCTHAKFINYAAPEAPSVYATETPFTTITWQSNNQEAYQIIADGKTYGPYFGTEKTYELPDYLEDGEHTIKIRILGAYGLWSNWSEVVITVENVPGSAVTLFAQSHIDTELSWETESETPNYLVFRDGKQIAKTNKTAFVDRFVTGEHSYYIINKLSDGNYTKSNEIDAGAILDTMYISLVNGGAWTKIRYNLVDQSDAGYEDSIDSTYNHLAGDVYPSATLGTYRESNVSLSAVFLYTEEEERKQFEALFGKLVIIKFKDGNVLFGVLDSWSKQARKHYWTGYTFTIRRVEWEDFVDDTD